MRPGTGREGGLGHVRRDYVQDARYIVVEHMDVRRDYVQDARYIAIEHMDKVRPGTGREGSLGYVRREAFQTRTAYQ